MKKILDEKEISRLQGMARYWQEVRGRDDKTPLMREAFEVYGMIGPKLLEIIEEYIKLQLCSDELLETMELLNDRVVRANAPRESGLYDTWEKMEELLKSLLEG